MHTLLKSLCKRIPSKRINFVIRMPFLLQVAPEAPQTTIQIRLDDGSRLVATLNHAHTVADLRRYVTTARPHLSEFTLRTSYPPKELTDDAATLESAGLLNAALLLRRK